MDRLNIEWKEERKKKLKEQEPMAAADARDYSDDDSWRTEELRIGLEEYMCNIIF